MNDYGLVMVLSDWVAAQRTVTPEFEIFLRLVVAIALSAAIGLDRELRNHPAGLRTHMLTALAAALFTLVTFEIAAKFEISANGATRVDPLRIIEAVTAGVAFLAAGAIIQAGPKKVHGLTTGASMWLAGAIGLCCGAGFYSIASYWFTEKIGRAVAERKLRFGHGKLTEMAARNEIDSVRDDAGIWLLQSSWSVIKTAMR